MTRPAPLAGTLVLDLSRVLAGPWCAMILGDLGAEVIKVEHPRGGDDTRHWGPPYTGGESAYYLCANRGKRSVAVDLATADGQEIVRGLAAKADILIENYKLGGLAKYGLDYASVAAINPRLVYCSISGYGRTGPRAAEAGYDYVIQAEGGLMAINGPADGAPIRAPVAVADLFTGMAAAQAVLAASIAQARDGIGQHIDMALYDNQLAMLANVGSAALVSGEDARRTGDAHPAIAPYQTFEASDGRFVVAVGNDGQFRALCAGLPGCETLPDDPDFATNAGRSVHRDRLIPRLQAAFATRPQAEWLAMMRARGVPCGSVRGVRDALTAPETVARGMVASVDHPTAGSVGMIASPLHLSGTPVVPPTAPPLLGEHTDAVLSRHLGYSADRIAALRDAGVIA